MNDSSRKFWLKIKEVFENKQNINRKLLGMLSSHGDDFNLAGTKEFILDIMTKIRRVLDISKIEDNSF